MKTGSCNNIVNMIIIARKRKTLELDASRLSYDYCTTPYRIIHTTSYIAVFNTTYRKIASCAASPAVQEILIPNAIAPSQARVETFKTKKKSFHNCGELACGILHRQARYRSCCVTRQTPSLIALSTHATMVT